MNPTSNVDSWDELLRTIEEHPDTDYWIAWKNVARRFVRLCVAQRLTQYFRAARSMNHLVFSTVNHHRLKDEPRVSIELLTNGKIRVAYGTTNLFFASPVLEYTLPFDDGFATFRRFLQQLWAETTSEPLPEDLSSLLSAPIL